MSSKQECSKNFYNNSNPQGRAESMHTDRHTETTSNLEEIRAKSPPYTECYPTQHLPIAANPNEIPQYQPNEAATLVRQSSAPHRELHYPSAKVSSVKTIVMDEGQDVQKTEKIKENTKQKYLTRKWLLQNEHPNTGNLSR